jgi:pyruvate kinase
VEAVAMLAKISGAVEPHRHPLKVKEMFPGMELKDRLTPAHLIALSVEASLEYTSPAAVFVPTHSGASARSISRFRPRAWIVGVSSQETVCQGLQFSYGVYPVCEGNAPDDWKSYIRDWLKQNGVEGNPVLLTAGPSTKYPHANHRLEIIDLKA